MKKMVCAILLIVTMVMVGCSSKTANIRRVTISTNPVSSVAPNNPTDGNSNNSKPNKATADVNGYKKLNTTSITVKVVGSDATNFYKLAQLTFIYFVLKDCKNDKSIATIECSDCNRSSTECVIATSSGRLGSVKLEKDQCLLCSKMYFDGAYRGKQYVLNQSIVAPLEKLSDTKAQANFRLVLEDNIRIRVRCEFDIEFVESL